ncbi:MAG: HAMP domain-containing histidine kinase [Chloroflexi bacterium]|nr:HAMP domain-containing histidine kinase [Chloroflexota bacterium]
MAAHSHHSRLRTFRARLAALWWRSIEPSMQVVSGEHRQEGRLIAGLALVILLVAAIGISITIPYYTPEQRQRILPTCAGLVLFTLPYYWSRHGRVVPAITSMAAVAGLLIGTAMFAVGGAVGMEFAYYFILVSIFVSVFLSRRQTMLCVVGVAIAILAYQWANPELSLMTTLRGPLAFNLFATGFVSVFTSFWRLREREKRRQLEESERKRAQLLVRQERQRALGQFVAAISHDFANRLSSIEVNQYLMRLKLEKGASVESVTPHLSITSVSIQQLKSQMENLKLLIGLGDIVPAPVDLSVVADSTFRKLSALAVEREIRLESIGHSGGVVAYGDGEDFEVALAHLVQNAIAFTPAGGRVTIEAALLEGKPTLTVADTGIGIPTEHIPHIFEAFYKVADSRGIDIAGLGLGLTIVRMIVEAFSGQVSVESRVDQGSMFRLTFPAEPALPDQNGSEQAPAHSTAV